MGYTKQIKHLQIGDQWSPYDCLFTQWQNNKELFTDATKLCYHIQKSETFVVKWAVVTFVGHKKYILISIANKELNENILRLHPLTVNIVHQL